MNISTKCAVVLAAMAAEAAFATPQLTIDRVQQRYPWNGLVDVDYTISGMTMPADHLLRVKFSYPTAETTETVIASNFLEYAFCDLPTENGTHRITWDSAADGAFFHATNVTAKLELLDTHLTAETADFVIMKLNVGRDYWVPACQIPIRFVSAPSSAVFNRELYKTDRMVMKRVPKGEFWMGEGKTDGSETRHYVKLTEDYYLSIFEITHGQWTNNYAYGAKNHVNDPATLRSEPMENIAFTTSKTALYNLSRRLQHNGTGVVYEVTFPTEAQWEYACRAGTTGTTPYGEFPGGNDLTNVCWCSYNDPKLTAPQVVGLKPANPWGFYDMIGNVSEWCSDIKGDYPSTTPENPDVNPTGGTPTGDDKQDYSVIRGGHFEATSTKLKSGCRDSLYRSGSWHQYGLRPMMKISTSATEE